MIDSYDYVINHLENKFQRGKYRPDLTEEDTPEVQERWRKYFERREEMSAMLADEIRRGVFRVTLDDVQDIHVKDGPKERDVQAPRIIKRIGIHAIMVIVEKHCYPDLIKNSAASVKGRGMHWLHHILEDDLRAVPEMMTYYYQSDIAKFYDTIPQDKMMECIRTYISDPVLLPILDNFITLMPNGLSKGLRSSQCFANLYLTPVHKRMLQEVPSYTITNEDGITETRHLYYNYCDDTEFFGADKKEVWRLRDIYVSEVTNLGLTVKPNEAVRPIEEGCDCLGYVHYPTHSLLRKRVKQNAARKLAKVKSRKRRQEIIGSFKGMACHADCKNLFQKLTNKKMKKFSDMGISYTPADGKKRFPGKVMRLAALQNKAIEVHDYQGDVTTSHGADRYIVSFRDKLTGEWGKFFTSSEEMKNILDQVSDVEDGFPFETVIMSEVFDGNKVKYKFT